MCLLVLAWRTHPQFRLVVAANRDEFHARAAAPLAPWTDLAGVVGGRDLQAGGAWFASTKASASASSRIFASSAARGAALRRAAA